MTTKVIGVDVGSVFTDLILLDEVTPDPSGRVNVAKLPSTLEDPADAVIAALLATQTALPHVPLMSHAVSLPAQKLAAGKLPLCGLVTNDGLADWMVPGFLPGQGLHRDPETDIDPETALPRPLRPAFPRDLRREVGGRLGPDGSEIMPLAENEITHAAQSLLDAGAEALLIHFLHSWANPDHELRALELVQEIWPNPYIVLGHKMYAVQGERQRSRIAAATTALQPVLGHYLDDLRNRLRVKGFANNIIIMKSSGGGVSALNAPTQAAETVEGGTGAGLLAAGYIAAAAGFKSAVALDMGGTRSRVSVVGEAATTHPALSGGGVGSDLIPLIGVTPELFEAEPSPAAPIRLSSAGLPVLDSDPTALTPIPGPMLFGRGGEVPTLTDAQAFLGRFDLSCLDSLGMAPPPDALESAFARIGRTARHQLTAEQVASAALRLAATRIAAVLRRRCLAVDEAPETLPLIAYGGFGPSLASAIAREAGISKVLIPSRPGIMGAIGAVISDLRHDMVRSLHKPLSEVGRETIEAVLNAHIKEGEALLENGKIPIEGQDFWHAAEIHIPGRPHHFTLTLETADPDIEALEEDIVRAYIERYGTEPGEFEPVLAALHTTVIGRRRGLTLGALFDPRRVRNTLDEALTGYRSVWFTEGWKDTPVYRREHMPHEASFLGPAIIEQHDTTLVIEPLDHVRADGAGNLIVTVNPK